MGAARLDSWGWPQLQATHSRRAILAKAKNNVYMMFLVQRDFPQGSAPPTDYTDRELVSLEHLPGRNLDAEWVDYEYATYIFARVESIIVALPASHCQHASPSRFAICIVHGNRNEY